MNRLHNKHKNTNKKRTCKSNKGTRKTLKSYGIRRGLSNKKGGSKGCLSCFSCFSKRTGPHSQSNTTKINNEIKQLYIYTIYYGILFHRTAVVQYLLTFNEYKNKLISHIAYLTTGQHILSEEEQMSKMSIKNVPRDVKDLEGALGKTQGSRRSQLEGVNDDNTEMIIKDWQTVKDTAEQDQQHPFEHLNALLTKYTVLFRSPFDKTLPV
jgi:hypothetical protein